MDLTPRQLEIYNFIVQFKQTNGYSPSWKEICEGVAVAKQTVQNSLIVLEEKGYIRQQPNKRRCIVVLKFL